MSMLDRFAVSDHSAVGLSQVSISLPLLMQCPQGHRAEQHIHCRTDKQPPIPYYACYDCQIVYRYQELTPIGGL